MRELDRMDRLSLVMFGVGIILFELLSRLER